MTDLRGKLQVRPGQVVAGVDAPAQVPPDLLSGTDPATSDAVLVWVLTRDALTERLDLLRQTTQRGAVTWVAYPKAGALQTDLKRDVVREVAASVGLDTVRQVAVDDTWSALRLKALT